MSLYLFKRFSYGAAKKQIIIDSPKGTVKKMHFIGRMFYFLHINYYFCAGY